MKTRKNKSLHLTDYKSNDGMLTSVWGPSLWHSLHTISFNYPNNPNKVQKKYHKQLLESLKYTLPCGHCRENIIINLKKNPITSNVLKNRHNFSLYVYKLHETINTLLNKRSGLTFEDVRERYEHFRARCIKKVKTRKVKKHKGCTIPLHKFKSKGIIKIVPSNTKCDSLEIDNKCKILNIAN
tara:strand:+ start:4451 stop:4999 length:549 start_codon:yes stop_codon:yes gene_type:complete